MPVGAKVKDTQTKYNGKPIVFSVMEHNHTGDPAGSTALVTSNIITLKCFDAIEAGNSDSNRRSYGNNRWLYSNIKQWLNSEKAAGQWYAAQHGADAPPNNGNVWTNYNEYDNEAGFLTNFSAQLKAALMTVTKRTAKNTVTDGGGYEDVTQKIFLLSNTEVGLANENSVAEGSIYALFGTASNRQCKPTSEAVSRSEYSDANFNVNANWYWWLRTPNASYSYSARHVIPDGGLNNTGAYGGGNGVRPACVVSSSILVSDAADTDGAYTIIWNAPPVISTDGENLGDKNAPFDLRYSITDADNDSVTATVKLDGETVQTIDQIVLGHEYSAKITAAKINSLAEGAHTLTIKAEDAYGNSSTKTVNFNRVTSSIAISGADSNIGNKWQPFEVVYQVNDSGFKSIDITEYVDDTEVRTISEAQQNQNIAFDLSGFDSLEDEQAHRLTIKAVNSDGAEAYRYIDFKKLYKELCFEIKPVETDAPARKVMINIDYDKAGGPGVKVEVTNCAYNAEVVWENATEAFRNKEAYHFTNTAFDGERYGVSVRVTVAKNSNTERVYVSAIGYSFD